MIAQTMAGKGEPNQNFIIKKKISLDCINTLSYAQHLPYNNVQYGSSWFLYLY